MKIVCVGLALLLMWTLASAATADPSVAAPSNTSTQQADKPVSEQITAPVSATDGSDALILSREEADAMSMQSDSLLAQSDIDAIKVGSIGNDDLIYVLVVVLLVVVIIAVIR